jgi:mono/diheme cytochrome c family protein
MNPETQQPSPSAPGPATPQVGNTTVPVWLLVLMILLLYWSALYFDEHSGWFSPDVYSPYTSFAEVQQYQPVLGDQTMVQGRRIFENICALCHNTDGSGKSGQAPPLAGSEFALGSPNRMIRIPLVGLNGPVQVKGQAYNLSMAAMGATLSDDDLAAVLSYIRQSFGNKASAITPEEVKAIRVDLKGRVQPYTAAELTGLPEPEPKSAPAK